MNEEFIKWGAYRHLSSHESGTRITAWDTDGLIINVKQGDETIFNTDFDVISFDGGYRILVKAAYISTDYATLYERILDEK